MAMKLKIRQPEIHPRSARIWLDGHEITAGLQAITVNFEANDITTAELRIAVVELDVDAVTLAVLEAHVLEQAVTT